jgi:hypothetical protein
MDLKPGNLLLAKIILLLVPLQILFSIFNDNVAVIEL